MSARKIEQDPPHIAAARARLMDEVCAALPPEAVYRQSPPMTDTPGALEERLRTTRLLSQRNQMALQAEAADEIASLRARVAKLEGALDPFATATEDIDENEPGDINMWEHPASMNVYISDFRDARQALKDTPVE